MARFRFHHMQSSLIEATMEKLTLGEPALPVAAPLSSSSPVKSDAPPATSRRRLFRAIALLLTLYLSFTYLFSNWPGSFVPRHGKEPNFADKCVQAEPLFPSENPDLDKVYEYISGDAFRNETIKRLSGAIQVKSPCTAKMWLSRRVS